MACRRPCAGEDPNDTRSMVPGPTQTHCNLRLILQDGDMEKKTRYRIHFLNNGKTYELFAREVYQDEFYGFVTIEGLLFGERSQVVVDPSEERLRTEFEGVERFHVPMHALIRIDEVTAVGTARIRDASEAGGNVHAFPGLPGKGNSD